MKQLLVTFLYGLGTIILSPILLVIYLVTQLIGLIMFIFDLAFAVPRFVLGIGKHGKKDKYTLALDQAKLNAQTQVASQPSVVFVQQPMPQAYGYAAYPQQGQPIQQGYQPMQQGYQPYPQQPQQGVPQQPYNQVPPPNQWNGGKR